MQRIAALLLPDRFIVVLLATVAAAAIWPARGEVLAVLGPVSTAAIVTLFFVHGARLSRTAVIGGFTRLRLHLTILAFCFAAFPLIGLGFVALVGPLIGERFLPGILFLCALPTTVASSIAMVSMARGNVAASVIAAALSSMAGVVLTPLAFALMLSTATGSAGIAGIGKIALTLALPFALGQLARPWIGGWIEAHPAVTRTLDRVTILLAVYVALSAALGSGLLSGLSAQAFLTLLAAMLALLTIAGTAAVLAARLLGFDHGDRMALLFAGVQKSVVSGTPMARVLFPGAEAGLIIVPLLVYYVPMLTISAILASRIGARHEDIRAPAQAGAQGR